MSVAVIPLLILVSLLFVSAWAVWRGVTLPPGIRSGAPSCGSCGYAVADLTNFTCPECGRDLREVGIDTPAREARRRGSLLGALIGWSFLSLVCGSVGIQVLGAVGAFAGPMIPARTTFDWTQGLAPRSGVVQQFGVSAVAGAEGHAEPIVLELRTQDGLTQRRWLAPSRMAIWASDGPEMPWESDALSEWFESAGVPVDDPVVSAEIEEITEFVESVAATPGPAPAWDFVGWREIVSASGAFTTGPIFGRTNRVALGAALAGIILAWVLGVVMIIRRRRQLMARHGVRSRA